MDDDGKSAVFSEADLEAVFREIETRAEEAAPGVLDLVRAYGDYEQAVLQADAYFSMLAPLPRLSTTSNS